MADDRIRRGEVARRGPIRNRAVRVPDSFRHDAVGGNGAPSQFGRAPTGGGPEGAVEGAVGTAYTVIEQYMTRGQSAASYYNRQSAVGAGAGQPTYGPGRAGPGAGPIPWGFGPPGDPWGIGMWMRPWLQMMRMWSDGLSMLGAGAATGPGSTMIPSARGPADPPIVSVEVASRRQVRVSVDVPGAAVDGQPLSIDTLTAPGPRADTLSGVEILASRGRCLVRLRVSESQAPGVYVGPVRDRLNRQVGELSVQITGVANGPAARTPVSGGEGA